MPLRKEIERHTVGFWSRVGVRLSLAFAFVAVVGILVLLVAISGYREVQARYADVVEESQPALVAAQGLAIECSRVEGTLIALDRAVAMEELEKARDQANRRRERLDESLTVLSSFAVARPDAKRVTEVVARLAERERSFGENVERRLRRKGEITQRTNRLLFDLTRLESDLSPLLMAIRERAFGFAAEDDDRERRVREVEGALSLEASLSAARAYVPGLLQATELSNLSAFEERFQFEVGTMSRSLIELADDSARTKLATDLDVVVEDVRGEDGLMALLRVDLEDRALAASSRREARVDVQEMNEAVQRLLSRTESVTRDAAESARSTIRRERRTLIALTGLSLLAMAAVLWFYVRGHVARRLSELREALARLARGDLETEIGLEGDDEFRQLATALETLRRRTRELSITQQDLARRNADLDQFVRIASHDLKSPLRAIDNLATFITEDERALSSPSRENLETVRQRVERMQSLVDDLLRFARLGERTAAREEVNLGVMVDGIISLLDVPDGLEVRKVGVLPTVSVTRIPLELVLRNLVDNALKHHDREVGFVAVAAEVRDGSLNLRVEDDGPGIPKEMQEKAFRIFSQLGSPEGRRALGSGIGLALVHKAVTEAGGTIRIDTPEERGARFVLTWPVDP